ncbi:MAG: NAD(P)/FAD-dependent oxidoreductase [Phycisphaerales bacterium]
MKWDVLVIGAGPAGCLAAAVVARCGARVLLVERAAMPRSKVCGCCLSARGVGLLQQVGVLPILVRRGARAFDRVRLRCGRYAADIHVPAGLAASRSTLDSVLLEHAARAGVAVQDGTSARVLPEGLVELSGRSESRCHAAAVVVADGIGGSSLRDYPGLRWSIRRSSKIGLGVVLGAAPIALTPGVIAMHVGPGGYAGMVMLEGGRVDVAAAVGRETVSLRGPGGAVDGLLSSCGVEGAWARRARWHGTPALTRRRNRVWDGRVFVIGDAAGYVEPFTGEGMTWAMESGVSVAACVRDHLEGVPGAGPAWERASRWLLGARRRACGVVAWAAGRPRLVEAGLATVGWVQRSWADGRIAHAGGEVAPWVHG